MSQGYTQGFTHIHFYYGSQEITLPWRHKCPTYGTPDSRRRIHKVGLLDVDAYRRFVWPETVEPVPPNKIIYLASTDGPDSSHWHCVMKLHEQKHNNAKPRHLENPRARDSSVDLAHSTGRSMRNITTPKYWSLCLKPGATPYYIGSGRSPNAAEAIHMRGCAPSGYRWPPSDNDIHALVGNSMARCTVHCIIHTHAGLTRHGRSRTGAWPCLVLKARLRLCGFCRKKEILERYPGPADDRRPMLHIPCKPWICPPRSSKGSRCLYCSCVHTCVFG